MTKAFCVPKCGNVAISMPPYPPFWTGGGTTPPIDPTTPYVYCPTIPSTIQAGSADAVVRVTGQNFVSGTHTVYMNGVAMPTTFVSASELSFTATHADRTTAGVETIEVRDGTTVIPTVCQFTYTAAPLMVLTCPLIPISVMIGAAALTVQANGQNFTTDCVGTMDGADLPTVYVSPTRLNLTIDPTAETVRQAIIGVRNTVTGVASTVNCPFDFLQTVLVPTLTNIDPDMVGRYDAGKTITYTGTNFDANSVILRGAIGQIPTLFINSTTLETTTDPATATVAMFEMRVRNGVQPGGPYELSNNMQATCTWNPGLNMLVPNTAPISGGPITVQVLGTNFTTNPTVMDVATDTPLPTLPQSGGWIDVTLTPPAAPGVQELTVRLGHQHTGTPIGDYHDNIRPSALNTQYPGPLTLPFTWT